MRLRTPGEPMPRLNMEELLDMVIDLYVEQKHVTREQARARLDAWLQSSPEEWAASMAGLAADIQEHLRRQIQ